MYNANNTLEKAKLMNNLAMLVHCKKFEFTNIRNL